MTQSSSPWHFGDATWILLKGPGTSYTLRTGRHPYLITTEERGQPGGNYPKLVFLTKAEFARLQAQAIKLGPHSPPFSGGIPSFSVVEEICPRAPVCTVRALLTGHEDFLLSDRAQACFAKTIGMDVYKEILALLSL
jgi:hypothetical protein